MKQLSDEDIQKFLDENSELFKCLSQNIWCPRCQKVVEEPLKNLGPLYSSFEGCIPCYEAITKES